VSVPEFVRIDADTRHEAIRWFRVATLDLPSDVGAPRRLVWIVLQATDTPLSRRDLVQATGLAYSSVHDCIEDLDDLDLLTSHDTPEGVLYTADPRGVDDA
jgi:hypothetical protein